MGMMTLTARLPQAPHTAHRLPGGEQAVVRFVEHDGAKHHQVQARLNLLGVGDQHLGVLCVLVDPGFTGGGVAVGQDDGADAVAVEDVGQAGLDVALAGLPDVQQHGAVLLQLGLDGGD